MPYLIGSRFFDPATSEIVFSKEVDGLEIDIYRTPNGTVVMICYNVDADHKKAYTKDDHEFKELLSFLGDLPKEIFQDCGIDTL